MGRQLHRPGSSVCTERPREELRQSLQTRMHTQTHVHTHTHTLMRSVRDACPVQRGQENSDVTSVSGGINQYLY